MVSYIDLDLRVDASHTCDVLGWQPRRRLFMKQRMAFLIEHMKSDPVEWHQRNQAALKEVHLRANLRIHRLLEKHQDAIRARFLEGLVSDPDAETRFPSYQSVSPQVMEWRFTVALRHILNSVRTRERGLFLGYCRDFAAKRFSEDFGAFEVIEALQGLNRACLEVLRNDPEADGLDEDLQMHLTTTIEFGCDEILEVFEDLSGEDIEVDF